MTLNRTGWACSAALHCSRRSLRISRHKYRLLSKTKYLGFLTRRFPAGRHRTWSCDLPWFSLDRGFGFIRKWSVTDAAAYEGRCLRHGLLDKTNTASSVWADTAYRSAANEEFMERNDFVSHVHRKRPKGRPMPEAIRRADNAKSKIRSRVEHVFAEQKDRMGLFIRTIGIARARTKIGLANLVYNIKRLLFLRRIAAA